MSPVPGYRALPPSQVAARPRPGPGSPALLLLDSNPVTRAPPLARRPRDLSWRGTPTPTPLPRDLGQPSCRETSAHCEALPSPQGREPSPGHTPPGPLPTCGRRTLTQESGLPGLRRGDAQRSSEALRGPKKWRRSPSAETR